MRLLILAGFFLGIVTVIAAMVKVAGESVPRMVRMNYWASVIALAIICIFTTFKYTYYANPNTKVHGWPVPYVIFQRYDAESPWLDYVGLVSLLAYPMNLIIFLVVPSLILIGWHHFKGLSKKPAQ